MTHPLTWDELVNEVGAVSHALTDGSDTIARLLRQPRPGVTWEAHLVEAYGRAMRTIETATEMAGELVQQLRMTPRPADPLKSVLDEIVAEGHKVLVLTRWSDGTCTCETKRSYAGQPVDQSQDEAWRKWREDVEDGRADGPDLLPAARARLMQIRALRVTATKQAFDDEVAAERGALDSGAPEPQEADVELDREMAAGRKGSVPEIRPAGEY